MKFPGNIYQEFKIVFVVLAGLSLALPSAGADLAKKQMDFSGAKWIWAPPPANVTLESFHGGTIYFRVPVTIPPKHKIKSAEILITADNLFTLFVNGKTVADSENWSQPKRITLAKLLGPGRNIVAVKASNTAMGPAGLLVKIVVETADGERQQIVSDAGWQCTDELVSKWAEQKFDDRKWKPAYVAGDAGIAPWGEIANIPAAAESPVKGLVAPQEGFKWPEGGVVFVGEDCSLYSGGQSGPGSESLGVTVFSARRSRAYPEHDLPGPIKVGRKLFALEQFRPGVEAVLLVDAGKGAIGTPSVSFDGKWIYMSMAMNDEPFFHIYRISTKGGQVKRLTNGPFHDIDPSELPDGRIVFTSTRIGTFEEYHNSPSRSLFVMEKDGSRIQPLTHTFVFDNEAKVMADGRILFIREDNFFDRGKVETLLHAIHPDGTHGYTEFGLDLGPEYGGRLRAFYCGSPAPMPDGRVAFVSGGGIIVGRPGSSQRNQMSIGIDAGDVAAMPDGRLICTMGGNGRYEKIGILDPDAGKVASSTAVYDSKGMTIHSPFYLGPRKVPPVLSGKVDSREIDNPGATGFLFCQNARFTKNTTAGWKHVRAIRVLGGKGLTTRSSHAYIVHAGNESVELGTFPLAPDGSFSIEVPADMAIAFQAVDAEGRSELNEMSWIFVKPGEKRSCVGCHQPRQVTPPSASVKAQALQVPALRLLGQGRPLAFRGNNPAVTGLMELQFDRYREVAGLNRHGQLADPMASINQEISFLISQLKSRDENMKISAAQQLSIFRDPAAAPPLCARLKDGGRELRVAAAMAIAACGNRDSVPPLLDALNDSDALVAQAAAVALENLTGHAEDFNAFMVPEERKKQAEKWREWFGATGWNAIEQELIKRLDDKDRDVVRRAAVALGHTGGEAARGPLRACLTREREKNPYPQWKKNHVHDGTQFNSLSEVNPRMVQAVARALGYLKDKEAVPLLVETLEKHFLPASGNLFLAEACVEALGRIATPEIEPALTNAFARLVNYIDYTVWYGDHPALMACHASPIHYFILEALDAMEAKNSGSMVPHIIHSVPTDPDRALFLCNDDYETIAGRVIRRNDPENKVIETCLAVLGDQQAVKNERIARVLGDVNSAWAGRPDIENRAAHILSMTCRDRNFVPRINAALDRYRSMVDSDIPRVFEGGGLPPGGKMPVKNWVCFFLARTLGNLADERSVESLIAVLEQTLPEAATGYPDPTGPGILFLHNGLTPCYRAAAAWALGQVRDKRAVKALLEVVGNMRNAPDTRHAAAVALGRIGDESSFADIEKLAATYPEVSTRKALLGAAGK